MIARDRDACGKLSYMFSYMCIYLWLFYLRNKC